VVWQWLRDQALELVTQRLPDGLSLSAA
jgi:hypothetical protein